MQNTSWAEPLHITTRLYGVISQEAGHSIAWDIMQRLNGRVSRLHAMTLTVKDLEHSGISQMTAIHDAILIKDPEVARRAVDAHVNDASHIVKRLRTTKQKLLPDMVHAFWLGVSTLTRWKVSVDSIM